MAGEHTQTVSHRGKHKTDISCGYVHVLANRPTMHDDNRDDSCCTTLLRVSCLVARTTANCIYERKLSDSLLCLLAVSH